MAERPKRNPAGIYHPAQDHAYYGVADGSDAHGCRAGLQLHAVSQNFDMRDLAEVMPFRASPHRAQRNAAQKHSQKNSRRSCHTCFLSQAGGAAPVNYGDSLASTICSFAAAMMSAKLRKTRALSRLPDAAARRPARCSARKDPHRKIQASKARAVRPVRVPARSLERERGKTLAETPRAEPFRAAVHARALLQELPARDSHFRRCSSPPHPAHARIRTSRAFHSRHPGRTSASAPLRRSRFPRGRAGTERTRRQRSAARRFSAASEMLRGPARGTSQPPRSASRLTLSSGSSRASSPASSAEVDPQPEHSGQQKSRKCQVHCVLDLRLTFEMFCAHPCCLQLLFNGCKCQTREFLPVRRGEQKADPHQHCSTQDKHQDGAGQKVQI